VRSKANAKLTDSSANTPRDARISSYRPGLVDLAAGQISREIFVNDEIHQEERERVFARAWLFVGHETATMALAGSK
jgi:hypothetical protein